MKAARLLAMTRLVLREHARDRLLWVGVGLALLLAAGLRGVEWLNFGLPRARFLVDGALAAASFGGLALAVVATVHGLHRHIDSGFASILLGKRVGRGELLVAHWLAMAGLLAGYALMFCAGLSVAVAGAEVEFAEIAHGLALVWLRCAVVAALALALGAINRSLALALTLSLLAVASGLLRDVAFSVTGETGMGRIPLLAVPNLSAFDLGSTDNLLRLAAYAAGQCGLWLGIAWAGFRSREL
jgi:ABC-type transport system involved in multi-copper enzyme maturation permease subunit